MMKTNVFVVFFTLFLTFNGFSQSNPIPAFPGAEGYGEYATGGRGGRVVYVSNLKDVADQWSAGYKGSLRAALMTAGNDPITIVFKCGGVINLTSTIVCTRSNVTIAGQTALGNGICIKGYGIKFNSPGIRNIILRHLRFRVGDAIEQNDPALTFSNGKNVIFDHCSFSWSVEENINITDVDSVTLQWCINTESLYNSIHIKGERAYAAQWGGEHASYHHNLLAHHNTRMPRQNGNTSNDHHLTWDYRNNVHYNWGNDGAFYGGGIEEAGGYCHSNLINNYYKPGPATTTNKSNQFFCAPSGGRPAVVGTGNDFLFGYGLWYLNGNFMYDNPAKTSDNWSGLSGSTNFDASGIFTVAPVTTTTADQAYTDVLANAGATLPKRDSIDTRIINEVKTGTAMFGGEYGALKGIIDHETDIKPSYGSASWTAWDIYAKVDSTNAPLDSDRDGIPDAWETANSLNPNNAADGSAIAADGYSNLEHYLNSITAVHTSVSNITSNPNILRIYPNPATEQIFIENDEHIVKVELYDATGKLVSNSRYYPGTPMNIGNLHPGFYIVKTTSLNGQIMLVKIVKNN
jgi:hypothetical protein